MVKSILLSKVLSLIPCPTLSYQTRLINEVICYLAKNEPNNMLSAWRSGERANVSIIFVGSLSQLMGIEGPHLNLSCPMMSQLN